jgi:hypothetical protein
MNYQEVLETRKNYHIFRTKLAETYKCIEIIDKFGHISGKKVIAKAIVKGYFSLDCNCVVVNTAIISTMNPNLEDGWLKLASQNYDRLHTRSLEQFLSYEDWDDSKEQLTCKIEELS